jgi:hypothetical protein
MAMTLRNLGMLARSQGLYARAANHFRESLDCAESLGQHGHPYARALCHLGRTLHLAVDTGEADRLLREALQVIGEIRQAVNALADGLEWLAAVEASSGRLVKAVRLLGAADAIWRASGGARYAPDLSAYENDLGSVRTRFDEDVFKAEWAARLGMRPHEALAYAFD